MLLIIILTLLVEHITEHSKRPTITKTTYTKGKGVMLFFQF